MTLDKGTRLAHYEVVESIGAGGMGEVYRARDTKLGRDVAIKVLPEEFSSDKDRLDRFEREARLLAQLNHPNIATLHGLEEHEGQQFLVMELVEGETLAERIAEGPIPVDEAIPLFIQIAEGIEAAHEKGIIHRDLKPANIKIGPDGKPKILDFGLAKAFASGETVPDSSQSPTLTKGTALGAILGTAAYMSPEQARGKAVDKRTDIWAFGCCFYEALMGTRAFVGETVSDTMAAILAREPEWDGLPRPTPAVLVTMLRRTLTKDLHRRLHDIGDARLEIESALEAPGGTDASPVTRPSFVGWIVAAAAIALAIWSLTRPTTPNAGRVTRSILPLAPGTHLALEVSTGPAVAISPDGRAIAYRAGRDGVASIYLQALDELEPTVVDTGQAPFFSSDSAFLGYKTALRFMKVATEGGAPVAFSVDTGGSRGASWGEDGIVFTPESAKGLSILPADGREPIEMTHPERGRLEKTHRFPHALPGGEALFTLLTGDMDSYDDASIAISSRQTGEHRVLLEGGMSPHYVRTGHIVYGRGGSLFAVPFDLGSLEVTGTPTRVLDGVMMSRINGGADFAISHDGTLVYAPGRPWGEDATLVWLDRRGEVLRKSEARGAFSAPSFSPDGKHVAVAISAGNDTLWLYDVARDTLTRMTSSFDNLSPTWSPDGRSIIYTSSLPGIYNLYRIPVDRSVEPQRLTPSEFTQIPGSYSPDGTLFAFHQQTARGTTNLHTVSLEDGETRSLLESPFSETDPRFSPDGRWFAYTSDESGRNEVYIRRFPPTGSKWQISTAGGTYPEWNPNGRELLYRHGDSIVAVEVRMGDDLTLGTPTVLFDLPPAVGYRGPDFDVSPDGKEFVLVDNSNADPPPTYLVLVQHFDEELRRLAPTK